MKKTLSICFKTMAVLLTIVMLIGILPMSVLAEDFNVTETAAADTASGGQAEIVSELVTKRDEYTKVFLRADGSETAVISGAPLHFKEDGAWADIDNTLEEKTVDGESVLQNKDAAFTVSLPSDLSESNTISVENEGYTLSFGLQSEELQNKSSVEAQVVQPEDMQPEAAEGSSDAYAAAGLETKESAVLFEDVEKDTDIQYVVNPTGLKENIILNEQPEDTITYTYTVSAQGLTAVLNDDNSIKFSDTQSDVIFTLPAPFMTDTQNAVSYDVTVSLSGDNGTYTVTYEPSMSWLSDEARVYPVTLDPVVSVSEENAVEDALVCSDYPNNNYGNNGWGIAINSETPMIKSAMYFKLGAYEHFENVQITKATLNIYGSGYGAVGVKSISESWIEGEVTYNTAPDLSEEYLDYANLGDYQQNQPLQNYSFDVTQHYINWQTNTNGTPDYGVAIVGLADPTAIVSTTTHGVILPLSARPVRI